MNYPEPIDELRATLASTIAAGIASNGDSLGIVTHALDLADRILEEVTRTSKASIKPSIGYVGRRSP